MRYRIGFRKVKGPIGGAEFGLPDDAIILGSEKTDGTFSGGAGLAVFYAVPIDHEPD